MLHTFQINTNTSSCHTRNHTQTRRDVHVWARHTFFFTRDFNTLKWVVLTKYIIAVCYRNFGTRFIAKYLYVVLVACWFASLLCSACLMPFARYGFCSFLFFLLFLFIQSSLSIPPETSVNWKLSTEETTKWKPTGWCTADHPLHIFENAVSKWVRFDIVDIYHLRTVWMREQKRRKNVFSFPLQLW